jgi:hypothetical protein
MALAPRGAGTSPASAAHGPQRAKLAAEMMSIDTGPHADRARWHVGKPYLHCCATTPDAAQLRAGRLPMGGQHRGPHFCQDIAGTDNHEDRSLWLSVRSPNRQDIDHHMVMRLPREAGIQVLKRP